MKKISIHALREEGDWPASRPSAIAPLFLSTPSARRATVEAVEDVFELIISIHALREEGDQRTASWDGYAQNFYPRPPRGGRRFIRDSHASQTDFYPRPPRGGRRRPRGHEAAPNQISIHALREEGDVRALMDSYGLELFLSTPSARRATRQHGRRSSGAEISIHALREEGD